MYLLLLPAAVYTVMIIIRKILAVEHIKPKSFFQETALHALTLFYGAILIFLMLLIPYCMWKLTGSMTHWGAVYIIAITFLCTTCFVYAYYYKIKSKVH